MRSVYRHRQPRLSQLVGHRLQGNMPGRQNDTEPIPDETHRRFPIPMTGEELGLPRVSKPNFRASSLRYRASRNAIEFS